eukprot:172555_1
MQIYRHKFPTNTHITTIKSNSKVCMTKDNHIYQPHHVIECQNENWCHKKFNEVTIFYEEGYAYYHCEYVIGPFLLCIYLMHDFEKQITYINQFKLFHEHLNIFISKVILIINEQHSKGISRYQINFKISNKTNTISTNRTLELTITVQLNDKLDEYSLSIHINKAP